MTPEQRQRLIEILLSDDDVTPEWSRILFPPEKREYELVYHGKEREEDIIANTLAVPLQPVRTFNKNGVEWHNKLIFGDNLQAMKTLLEMKRRGELCNADGTPGVRMCVENYHAILEHVNSSIRDSLKDKGTRVAVLNDEAHHVANETGATPGKWKEFLQSPDYGFRYVLGVSGTCYVGDEYFSDVVFRYSLRQAIEERFVKKVEYVAEMPATHGQEDRWQLIWQRHDDWKKKLKSRNIRPLTIVVTQKITACKQVTGKHSKFNATIRQKTFSVDEVAEQLYQRLKGIDQESADAEVQEDRTNYAKRFPREKCTAIVAESLKQAKITDSRITDDNRQKFLQALGPLKRKGAKRVIYVLAANALVTMSTATRQAESCSAAELRRGSKTVFYTDGCMATLCDEQREFFAEVADPDGDFVSGRAEIGNPADFKTPVNLAIADATPERKFIRELTDRKNTTHLDAWLKNAAMNFYSLEYAWKKGEHPKRGEFNPDFFIKQGEQIFVTEIKDDGEISDPSPENVKKHEYARAHFERLNNWLEKNALLVRYQFNMVSPRDFNSFFQKLREMDLVGFRSELDVTMINAGTKAA